MEAATDGSVDFEQNMAMQYAAARNILYTKGKKIEVKDILFGLPLEYQI